MSWLADGRYNGDSTNKGQTLFSQADVPLLEQKYKLLGGKA